MHNRYLTYRLLAICGAIVLLACSSVARSEYREQWLGTAEMQREADAQRVPTSKSARATGIPEWARKHSFHTDLPPVLVRTAVGVRG